MSTKTLMTVEQFAAMITADTENYELVEGELVPLYSGTPYHNAIRDNVYGAFAPICKAENRVRRSSKWIVA